MVFNIFWDVFNGVSCEFYSSCTLMQWWGVNLDTCAWLQYSLPRNLLFALLYVAFCFTQRIYLCQ
jgi:hypothetical protein